MYTLDSYCIMTFATATPPQHPIKLHNQFAPILPLLHEIEMGSLR